MLFLISIASRDHSRQTDSGSVLRASVLHAEGFCGTVQGLQMFLPQHPSGPPSSPNPLWSLSDYTLKQRRPETSELWSNQNQRRSSSWSPVRASSALERRHTHRLESNKHISEIFGDYYGPPPTHTVFPLTRTIIKPLMRRQKTVEPEDDCGVWRTEEAARWETNPEAFMRKAAVSESEERTFPSRRSRLHLVLKTLMMFYLYKKCHVRVQRGRLLHLHLICRKTNLDFTWRGAKLKMPQKHLNDQK